MDRFYWWNGRRNFWPKEVDNSFITLQGVGWNKVEDVVYRTFWKIYVSAYKNRKKAVVLYNVIYCGLCNDSVSCTDCVESNVMKSNLMVNELERM
jgi:hypothetical protein